MHILLVDDSSTMRRIQKNVLENVRHGQGDVIEEGKNGLEALAKLEAGTFDLLLMDWNMPELSGIDALKKIRNHPNEKVKNVKIIMVTSESEKDRILEAIKAGANDYMVKPFTDNLLREKITRLFPIK